MKVYSFEKLHVWQDARDFAILIYEVTAEFPKEELFGLTQQLRRASISVSSNIAEGSSRTSQKDKARFYVIAYGSLIESLSQSIIAFGLGYLKKDKLIQIRVSVSKISNMLNSLKKSTQVDFAD